MLMIIEAKDSYKDAYEEEISQSTDKKWLRKKSEMSTSTASRLIDKAWLGSALKMTNDQLIEMLNVKKWRWDYVTIEGKW